MRNEMKIASIYIKFSGDMTPNVSDMYHYLELAENFGSAAATASIISGGPLGASLFSNSMSYEDKVTTVFEELFGRKPLQGGLDYWVNQLENNSQYVNETSMAQAILRGAEVNKDQTDWNYIKSFASYYEEELEAYSLSLNGHADTDNSNNSEASYTFIDGLFTNTGDSSIYMTDMGMDYNGQLSYQGYSFDINMEGTIETGYQIQIGSSIQNIPGYNFPDIEISPNESLQFYNYMPDNIDLSSYVDMDAYSGEVHTEIDVITTVGTFTDSSVVIY